MSNHQQKYKKKPVGFTDASTGRLVRAVKHEERRRVNRAENFSKQRDVPKVPEFDETSSRSSDLVVKLRKWRTEREIKRKIETRTKKPAFKVGVVHHKFYSPPVSDKFKVKQEPCHHRGVYKVKHHLTPEKRITRATKKRLEAKQAGTAVTPAAACSSKLRANRKKVTKRRLPSAKKEPAHSFAPQNYSFKAPAGLEEIPLFGRFVIPKEDKINPKVEEETPWPTANLPSIDTMTSKIAENLPLLEAPSRKNSSLESFTLQLSSEDETTEATEAIEKSLDKVDTNNSDEKPVNSMMDFDFPEIVEKIEEPDVQELAELQEAIEMETATPSRSGTPVPASFSPYIVADRGKDSARKEQRMKLGINRSSPDEIPTKETVMQNLNISVEEEERTAQYFKFILQHEIDRLTELCKKWEAIMTEPDLTEDAQYQINQAVGQTYLLIRKKFERFRRLVSDCETGKGEMLVQCKDLQGFWDMMYMEVKDCESRFLKLDFLRSKGWIEEQLPQPSKNVTKKKAAPAKPKIGAQSAARSWILAARKKKNSQAENVDIVFAAKDMRSNESESETPPNEREANSRKSLRKSPPPPEANEDRRRSASKKTPTSLLKLVQLTQTFKSVRSPLAVMKISKMCKTLEVQQDDTITYVNSDQTPGKGILKKSEDSIIQESFSAKPTRKVDFNDDLFVEDVMDDNEVDEALENSIDLGRKLARIDAFYENDYGETADDFMANVTIRGAERRLDFENDSFNETENTDTAESAAIVAAIPQPPTIVVIPETPKSPPKPRRRSSRYASKDRESSIAEEKPEETSIGTRVLRNRTIKPETPGKTSRRSGRITAIDKHNFSLNSSSKENSDPLRETDKEANSEARDVSEQVANEDHLKIRRSTRKSVRFNADDYRACTPKPTLPMMPHARRSRKRSLVKENPRNSVAPQISGDLMSFCTL